MDELFTVLFRYRWFQYSEGDFSFQPTVPAPLLWLLLLASMGFLGWSLFQLVSRQHRFGWLLVPRGLFLALLFGLLLNPTLELTRMAPQTGAIVVLVDNSKSMGIASEGEARGASVQKLFAENSPLRKKLESDFAVRWVCFSAGTSPCPSSLSAGWDGGQTNLAAALEAGLVDAGGLPLAAALLVTDGVHTTPDSIGQSTETYAARGVPIHTIGVGPDLLTPDLELQEVTLPAEVLPGSAVVVRTSIRHPGLRGGLARLELRDGAALLGSNDIPLSDSSDLTLGELRFYPEFSGVRALTVSVSTVGAAEVLQENNSRAALLRIRDDHARILLVEGRPRWEFKFVRLALEGDDWIQLESILRTALNKFYRQGIEDPGTLAGGFPVASEELFRYDGLILGDVEASFFSYPQMEMINAFVGRRGGGLLALGGSHALGAGGFRNTPVAEVLPVRLGPEGSPVTANAAHLRAEAKVELTPSGSVHPALQLARSPEESQGLWREIPHLTDLSESGVAKPGATVFLTALPADSQAPSATWPLLAGHRYGRGLGLAFLTGSSWRWQMLKDSTDRSHETFWKQVCRWIVSSARKPVYLEPDRPVYSAGAKVRLLAEVRDTVFHGVNTATTYATITPPTGAPAEIPLRWDGHENGIYVGEWVPTERGLHSVEIRVNQGLGAGSTAAHFLAGGEEPEFFDSTRKSDLLKEISARTGGRYYPIETAEDLADEIVYGNTVGAVTETLVLWNLPLNLLLLLSLLGIDWVLRKRWGLA